MFNVLVVDDDPMVAEVNKRYVDLVPTFSCVYTSYSAADALQYLEQYQVNLVLLDIYMPVTSGLALLREIRNRGQLVDVIVISAASDMESVQRALHLGAVDYLIKPFEFERLSAALQSYATKHQKLSSQSHLSQTVLDNVLYSQEDSAELGLPKGLTKATLQSIVNAIVQTGNSSFSTNCLAEQVGISRVSIRKYLNFLDDIGFLKSHMNYQPVGRPVCTYQFNAENRNTVTPYLK
jgi:CitB family two-component system response regulator MalR